MNPNIIIPVGFVALLIILYIANLRKEKPPIKNTIIKENNTGTSQTKEHSQEDKTQTLCNY